LIESAQEIGRRLRPLVAAAIALAMLAAAGLAVAEEGPTRDEYVAQLETVCKPDAVATQAAMKGVRADVSAGRIRVAAGKFAKATRIFGSTVKEIAAAPRPAADAVKLDKWFTYLDRQESYLGQITDQLRSDHKIKAQRLTARFIHNGNLANNVVLAFGFDYCSFKFSRFG
jgi:hypothetical protein